MSLVTRFAPSPTGLLHEGHAFAALKVWDAARAAGGIAHLRIEDIDAARCRPDFTRAVFEDLAWLGLEWPEPVMIQSARLDAHALALRRLRDQGVLYRCFRTRREILAEIARAPHGAGEAMEDGVGPIYPGPVVPMAPDEEAERVVRGEPFAWRLSVARVRDVLGARLAALDWLEEGHGPEGGPGRIALDPGRLGDAVLARRDLATSYHLAVTVDDSAQGITHVIRGHDLQAAAHLHRTLQVLLDLPRPVWRHHRLLHGPDGARLSKRTGARTLRALRAAGEDPAALARRLRAWDT
jgi:glutamyl-Q tRNA(Asp) synthetase